MEEACGHALHYGFASLAPFHPVVKANQAGLAMVHTAQEIDVARCGLSKREREKIVKQSSP